MTQWFGPPDRTAAPDDEVGARIAQLRAVLALVEAMADAPPTPASDDFSGRWTRAVPVVRRRCNAIAAEAAGFAARGVGALLRTKRETGGEAKAAALRLASEMRMSLAAIDGLMGN